VRPIEPLLQNAQPHYAADPDLHRIVLNAVSWVEANLAVDLLAESTSEKALVAVANVREAIKELPRCPLAMALDFEQLARVWELERVGNAWRRRFDDDEGGFEVLLLGEGNYCYDIVVRANGRTLMWMPKHSEFDFLNAEVVDLIMERPAVLKTVVDLTQAMGLAFYPTFYLSLEDWRQEYAQTMFDEVVDLFSTEAEQRTRQQRRVEEDPHGAKVRYRGHGDDGGVSWLF
jgi:hypothetical protein